ncbi:hypothetical protein EVA_07960 [gut metagenome]|uniref:Uncharacterized protein n=1 Tax=gut metagenome TaxID=749906 RepID=J9G9H4_9ZZZZ
MLFSPSVRRGIEQSGERPCQVVFGQCSFSYSTPCFCSFISFILIIRKCNLVLISFVCGLHIQ